VKLFPSHLHDSQHAYSMIGALVFFFGVQANDQLIIDYRSGDDLYIKGLTFDACTATSCRNYNLLAFGSSVTQRIAMDYEGPNNPCSNFSYGDYVCQYDMVFDFKVMRKYADSSTIVGR